MSHNPNPWSELSYLEAQRFHEAYTSAHPGRLADFSEILVGAGFDRRLLDYSSVATIDPVWDFAIEHLDPAWNHPEGEQAVNWYPKVRELEIRQGWPQWDTRNTLLEAGLDFVSGIAACFAEVMIQSWHGAWVIDDGHSGAWAAENRSCIAVPGEGNYFVEPLVAQWYSRYGHNPPNPIWHNINGTRSHRSTPLDIELPDVEVERFDPDEMMPNWFHATISPDFTAQINRPLIDRFVTELQNQPSVAEAHQSDTEWVAVKSRRKRSEKHMQKVVDDAWSIAKAAHPPVLDHDAAD